MSITRPNPPGDRGPEPSGASGTSEGGVPSTGVSDGGAAVSSGGRQVRGLSFDGQSGVVPLARDFTRQALYEWGWLPADTADRRAAAAGGPRGSSQLVT